MIQTLAGAGLGGPVLSVRDLAMRYGEREALRGVSFDAGAGELVAVVGPNGAGKTTLLSILAGIQRPSAGSVNRTPREVGWVPQSSAVYAKLSVAENLELFARLEKVADPAQAVERMLEQTGLGERAGEQVRRLSGGNRQRVNVAIGLLADPPVLALDEPSSALDPAQRARLWDFVGSLAAAGTSVVFSTHDVNEVQRYAKRALVLAGGELLFDGSPEALLAAAGEENGDFEGAFVSFLHGRGHR
ncbi:MAG TPA: ABC transporter ATP-binding protein [Solirubrobacteraceae bacterium]|nr:ABC transporter ATP-binding protein [Solirubrobacteraceae bacterium]